jgi:quercetin dioxygenase-like cupin family protein
MPFLSVSGVSEKSPIKGYRGRFVHTENVTIAYWEIDADAPAPRHSHPHEQVVNVSEGEFELTVGDETKTLAPGDIAVIPGNVPHSGRAITDCRLFDVFHPVREDYR